MGTLYEALIRGNPDGTIGGISIEEWIAAGTNADGSPRYIPGGPQRATAADLTAFVGEQYAQLAAQVATLIAERDAATTERDALKTERDALQAQIAAAAAQAANAVTALQGRLAINTVAGLRALVEAAVAAGDQNTKDWWEFATVWHRDNALLNAVAAQVGLTTQQVDDLFAMARTL